MANLMCNEKEKRQAWHVSHVICQIVIISLKPVISHRLMLLAYLSLKKGACIAASLS